MRLRRDRLLQVVALQSRAALLGSWSISSAVLERDVTVYRPVVDRTS
jgi:hypothetical protein